MVRNAVREKPPLCGQPIAWHFPIAAPFLGTHKVAPTSAVTNLIYKPPNFSESSANFLAKRNEEVMQPFVLYITP